MPAYDVLIYGSTLAGIAAAKYITRNTSSISVGIISPWGREGGMVTGGLTISDYAGPNTLRWGITDEFFKLIDVEGGGDGSSPLWDFRAKWAAAALVNLIDSDADITFIDDEYIVSSETALDSDGNLYIVSVTTDQDTYTADHFVAADYECDIPKYAGLMMQAAGRDAISTYDENEAGAQAHPVDSATPVQAPADGDARLQSTGRPWNSPGDADARVQGFNFRLQVTDDVGNQIAWPQPPGYDRTAIFNDIGTPTAVITDVLQLHGEVDVANSIWETNQNDVSGEWTYQWDQATHPERVLLKAQIYDYFMGKIYYLANDASVPSSTKTSFSAWGLCADEFTTDYYHTAGMSPELYVREGSRILGEYIVTGHNVDNNTVVPDPVFVSGYFRDSHNVSYYPQLDGSGSVSEGHVDYSTSPAYFSIPMRALRPPKKACKNLVACWGISVSRDAWLSVRMEPTLMMAGEVCGMMIEAAIDGSKYTGDVTYAEILPKLEAVSAVTYYAP